MELTQCPEPSCDAPAEVLDRMVMSSTDGGIEHIKVRVPAPSLVPDARFVPQEPADERSPGGAQPGMVAPPRPPPDVNRGSRG